VAADQAVEALTKKKRQRGIALEQWEVAIVKAMLAKQDRTDQDILAYFTRPTRSVNHRLIGQIRKGTAHAATAAASKEELAEFLATWPEIDPQTGLSLQGDELLIKSREAMIAAVHTFNAFAERMSEEEKTDPRYSFRVNFIPVLANRPAGADQVIEFAKPSEGQTGAVTIIKAVDRPKYRAGQIVQKMKDEGYPDFTISKHTTCGKRRRRKTRSWSLGRPCSAIRSGVGTKSGWRMCGSIAPKTAPATGSRHRNPRLRPPRSLHRRRWPPHPQPRHWLLNSIPRFLRPLQSTRSVKALKRSRRTWPSRQRPRWLASRTVPTSCSSNCHAGRYPTYCPTSRR